MTTHSENHSSSGDAGVAPKQSREDAATAAAMIAEASAFVASLTGEQQTKAILPFEEEERFNWHYIPRERRGLPFKEMGEPQRERAHGFLQAGLSQTGYQKTTTIMSLEDVLRELEGGKGPIRDPELYFFTLFGKPTAEGTWGWRVEGHHISLNYTVVQGRLIASTPQFLGANPAEVRQGPLQGLRALRAEEDLARELLKALVPSHQESVVIDVEAPRDIITHADRRAEIGEPLGVAVSQMDGRQRGLLLALLDEYARAMPDAIAQERLRRLQEAGVDRIHFAWAGSGDRGEPHYYRVQGPTFLIEYDNTQNNANHIHSVWRDFEGDFGLDLLRQHYETAPHGHGH